MVGEVRGGEALYCLRPGTQATPAGCATVHANSARGGLTRLEQLVQEAVVTIPRELIAEAINLVIHIDRCCSGRRIREIIKVEGVQQGRYEISTFA